MFPFFHDKTENLLDSCIRHFKKLSEDTYLFDDTKFKITPSKVGMWSR